MEMSQLAQLEFEWSDNLMNLPSIKEMTQLTYLTFESIEDSLCLQVPCI